MTSHDRLTVRNQKKPLELFLDDAKVLACAGMCWHVLAGCWRVAGGWALQTTVWTWMNHDERWCSARSSSSGRKPFNRFLQRAWECLGLRAWRWLRSCWWHPLADGPYHWSPHTCWIRTKFHIATTPLHRWALEYDGHWWALSIMMASTTNHPKWIPNEDLFQVGDFWQKSARY